MVSSQLERYLTTQEVADICGVCTATVLRAAQRGELKSIRFGHRRRYSESAVLAWLESLASPSPGGTPA